MRPISLITLSLIVLAMAGCAEKPETTANYQIVPLPASIEASADAEGFVFSSKSSIVCESADSAMQTNARLLSEYLDQATGIAARVRESGSKNAIILTDTLADENPEAYRITVGKSGIIVDGASPAGTFYGIQTLRKSVVAADSARHGAVLFPAVTICDAPRFPYRGAHFDSARHFFAPDSVKIFIDMLAMHNINRFHWHLTDDQGWRIEIKSRPGLTEVGSRRSGTMIGHDFSTNDSIPYGGYYTQDELRDIVKYAADRHITVIPEVDLPGHMQAALAAYPSLGCTGGPYEVWPKWGVSYDVLCAGNDSIYALLDDVLAEVTEIFPSEYIHVGGDECPKARWKNCPKCQARIKALGLRTDKEGTAEDKLQAYVMKHATDFLASRGRRVIGWDEILEGGAPEGSVIMSWRGIEGAEQAARRGHDAIMSPCQYCYFDFRQSDSPDEPLAATWGNIITPDVIYDMVAVPPTLTEEEARHVIGVQANLWTEYIPTFWHAEYMELPRLAALSEVQWCADKKGFDDFRKRLPGITNLYNLNGYNVSPHITVTE